MQDVDEKMIDTVGSFSCPYQTERYVESYRDWRRRQNNRYAFRFKKNLKETAFSESQPVVSGSPAYAEQNVLQRISLLIAYLLMAVLLIENVADKLLVWVMGEMGLHINFVFWGESRLYGDDRLVFWAATAIDLLKYLIPAVAAVIILRMPRHVGFPMHIVKPMNLLAGMVLAMLMSSGMGMLLVSSSTEMEKYRMLDRAVNVTDTNDIFLFVLFTVFVIPIAFEFLIHGCLFQLLRQFGDRFAILATTILAAFMTHNLQDAVRIGILTLTISYFMVETGSFLTALALHVVHEIYMFAMFCLDMFGDFYSWRWWTLILIPAVLAIPVILFFLIKRKKPGVPQVHPYMSLTDQCAALFMSLPMIIYAMCCVLLMIVTAFLV